MSSSNLPKPMWVNSERNLTAPPSGSADSVAWGSPNERNDTIMETKTFYLFAAPAMILPVAGLAAGLGWAIISGL